MEWISGMIVAVMGSSTVTYSDAFLANKSQIIEALKSKYSTQSELSLETVNDILAVPTELGLIDIQSELSIFPSTMNGEGGGQDGAEVNVEDGVITVHSTASSYEGALSKVYCPKALRESLIQAKNKNDRSVFSLVDANCIEVYAFSNLGSGEGPVNIDHGFRYELNSGRLTQLTNNSSDFSWVVGSNRRQIQVYVLDLSQKERASGYSSGEASLGSRKDKTADFQLTQDLILTKADVIKTVGLDFLWTIGSTELTALIQKEGFSAETLAEFAKLIDLQRQMDLAVVESDQRRLQDEYYRQEDTAIASISKNDELKKMANVIQARGSLN